MATTKTRRCIGSVRFGIEPHDAPLKDFPKQPSQKDGLGRMCAVHWRAYVKALNAERKARTGATAPGAGAKAERATTRKERRRTAMASQPAPAAPKVRKARETLAATESLGGTAYTDAIASDEVQAALETINGHAGSPDGLTTDEAEGVEAMATEADPRSEEEIRALEV